jgi:predicted transcriptional regulator
MQATMNATDKVFQALASQPRRRIIDLVIQTPGCSVNEVAQHFKISRIAVMKHLGILVDARLIVSRKRGRTRELFFNAAPIQMIYDRWSDEYSRFWVTQAVDLKYKVEKQGRANKRKSNRHKNSSRTNTTVSRKANK